MIDTTTKTTPEYITVREVARRLGVSERHVERIISSNDSKKVGKVKIGRRSVRVHWPTFQQAVMSGTLRS